MQSTTRWRSRLLQACIQKETGGFDRRAQAKWYWIAANIQTLISCCTKNELNANILSRDVTLVVKMRPFFSITRLGFRRLYVVDVSLPVRGLDTFAEYLYFIQCELDTPRFTIRLYKRKE